MGAKKSVKKTARSQNTSNVVSFNKSHIKHNVELNPRNHRQEVYIRKLQDPVHDIVFGVGPAGTGKTMLAVQTAIKLFKNRQVDKIVLTRPAVSVDEDLGALPGTLEEKMAPWARPMFDVLREYFDSRSLEGMMREGVLEIAPLSYMRGRTFKNSFIVADECQLTTPNQMKMLLTRIGENSKMAITGDLHQADRGNDNGLFDFLEKYEDGKHVRISVVKFDDGQVERHPVVSNILEIYGK